LHLATRLLVLFQNLDCATQFSISCFQALAGIYQLPASATLSQTAINCGTQGINILQRVHQKIHRAHTQSQAHAIGINLFGKHDRRHQHINVSRSWLGCLCHRGGLNDYRVILSGV